MCLQCVVRYNPVRLIGWRLDCTFSCMSTIKRGNFIPLPRSFRYRCRDSIVIVSSSRWCSQSTCRNLLNRSISFQFSSLLLPIGRSNGRIEHQLPVTSARNKYVTTYRGHVLHNHKVRVTPYYLRENLIDRRGFVYWFLDKNPKQARIGSSAQIESIVMFLNACRYDRYRCRKKKCDEYILFIISLQNVYLQLK